MTKKTFAEKVKSFLKNGDTRKINRFYNEMISQYKDEIELLERENKRLEEKIEQAIESKADFVFNIDLDKIKSVDERINYATSQAQKLLSYDNDNILPLQEKLEENKEKITILKNTIKYLETVEPNIEED